MVSSSYLDAKSFGIGQLITQRKLFRVPEHQRDYSWTKDDVESFIDDIITALPTANKSTSEYFVGLVVLVGPRDNYWEILDGQQRLATTTMLYASIRNWLSENGYKDDADQIQNEFIAVRQLGGGYGPRLTLNQANSGVFYDLVITQAGPDLLRTYRRDAPKRSSNGRLIEAAILCREAVDELASREGPKKTDQADALFRLANFLERHVQVVVLDVSSETNAYVVFESLNDRGHELSVWDLVRNFLLGQSGKYSTDVKRAWAKTNGYISERSTDEFLKAFWTSRFGRVQRGNLFRRIREEFPKPKDVRQFALDLAHVSEQFSALDDASAKLWMDYSANCRHSLEVLSILGNRQVRPIMLSALDVFSPADFESLLRTLVVLTVRYQTIGQRRTGALEIHSARAAHLIYQKAITSVDAYWTTARTIIPDDDEFLSDFLQFSETKAVRSFYLLWELERQLRRETAKPSQATQSAQHLDSLSNLRDTVAVDQIGSDIDVMQSVAPDELVEWTYRLGNRCLVETDKLDLHSVMPDDVSFASKALIYGMSDFLTTKAIAKHGKAHAQWGKAEIERRQTELAQLALRAWALK